MKKWLKKALGNGGRERAEKLVTQGVIHAREGRPEQALACYREAVEADEELGVAHLNEGLALLDLFNRDAAGVTHDERAAALAAVSATLERALRLESDSIVGWRALAHVEERRRGFARAEDAWKRVRDLAPKDAPDRHAAEKALQGLADDARIDRARRRAIAAQGPDVDDSERQAALNELVALLRPGAVRKPVERGFALAGALARRSTDARARELLTQAVREDGADVDALRDLASVCLAESDLSAALAWSMKAYVARPTDAALVCNVGVCHLGLGDIAKAAEFIELAQKLEPKDPIVVRAVAALKAASAAQKPPHTA